MDKEMDQCLITLKKGGRSTAEAQVWMKMARNGLLMALECLDEQVECVSRSTQTTIDQAPLVTVLDRADMFQQ